MALLIAMTLLPAIIGFAGKRRSPSRGARCSTSVRTLTAVHAPEKLGAPAGRPGSFSPPPRSDLRVLALLALASPLLSSTSDSQEQLPTDLRHLAACL